MKVFQREIMNARCGVVPRRETVMPAKRAHARNTISAAALPHTARANESRDVYESAARSERVYGNAENARETVVRHAQQRR